MKENNVIYNEHFYVSKWQVSENNFLIIVFFNKFKIKNAALEKPFYLKKKRFRQKPSDLGKTDILAKNIIFK